MRKAESNSAASPDNRIDEPHRYFWADSLRGLACLIVMFAHIVATDPEYGMYANGCGKIGVWLFMLLSGFLFGRSSFYRKQKLSLSGVLRFYERKVLRIFPEYIIALVFAVLLGMFDLHAVKDMLLLRTTWGHFWYMPVIIKFYIMVPVLVVLRRVVLRGKPVGRAVARMAAVKQRRWLYCGVLTVISIGLALLFPFTLYPENSIEIRWYLPVFFMGVLLAEITGMVAVKSGWFDLLPVIGLTGILIFTPLGRQILFGCGPSRYLQNKYLIISSLWLLVLLGAIYGKTTHRILNQAELLQVVAAYSFGLYLFHFTILHWICEHYGMMQNWLRGLLTIMCSGVLTVLLKKIIGFVNRNVRVHVRMGLVIVVIVALVIVR